MRYFLIGLIGIGCGGVSEAGGGDDVDASPDGPVAAADAGDLDAPPPDAALARHTIFTTSSTAGPNMGGIDSAHARCQQHADDAGLEGTFRALLFLDETTLDELLEINGPVFNTNGDMVAAGPDEFFAGDFLAGNGFNESGGAPGDTVAYLGDGKIDQCANWTSSDDVLGAGQTSVTGTAFTSVVSVANCASNIQRSIQCISQ
jgi:hypothetical protein